MTDPDKAAELATKELQAAHADASAKKSALRELEQLAAHYPSLAKARQLLVQGKVEEAGALSLKIPPLTGYRADPFPLALLKSDILTAQGKLRQAYDQLVTEAAVAPKPPFIQVLEPLGRKIDKTPEQVRADILKASLAKAEPLRDWELSDLAGGKKSTAAHRGQVVLINFWAPS
jgi:hypothetical protein